MLTECHTRTILVHLFDHSNEPSLGLGLGVPVLRHGVLQTLVLGELTELALLLAATTSTAHTQTHTHTHTHVKQTLQV